MNDAILKADVLVEAIPYIHNFRQKVFVIKFGGSILDNATIRKNVLEDIVFLSFVGIRTILVHGGGPHITERLKEKGLKSEFHEGIRVTDKETLKIVNEELEKLNNRIVKQIKELKGDVCGLKGEEGVIIAEKRKSDRDLGFVGDIKSIDTKILDKHLSKGHIVVLSPMGISTDKQAYNINADEVAGAVGTTLKAEKLMLLTDVHGVLRTKGDPTTLISTLNTDEINNLIKMNVIQGGMIPKVTSCVDAIIGGVKKAHIVDARIQHALLLEIFTDRGIGTQILKK